MLLTIELIDLILFHVDQEAAAQQNQYQQHQPQPTQNLQYQHHQSQHDQPQPEPTGLKRSADTLEDHSPIKAQKLSNCKLIYHKLLLLFLLHLFKI